MIESGKDEASKNIIEPSIVGIKAIKFVPDNGNDLIFNYLEMNVCIKQSTEPTEPTTTQGKHLLNNVTVSCHSKTGKFHK